MDQETAIGALSALANAHRLDVFRRLVKAGPGGQVAGELAQAAGLAPPVLSFHLKELEHAGLIVSKREGRFVRYALNVSQMRGLIGFLTEDCCEGLPELCGAILQRRSETSCC